VLRVGRLRSPVAGLRSLAEVGDGRFPRAVRELDPHRCDRHRPSPASRTPRGAGLPRLADRPYLVRRRHPPLPLGLPAGGGVPPPDRRRRFGQRRLSRASLRIGSVAANRRPGRHIPVPYHMSVVETVSGAVAGSTPFSSTRRHSHLWEATLTSDHGVRALYWVEQLPARLDNYSPLCLQGASMTP
jgi:hypothetical protein